MDPVRRGIRSALALPLLAFAGTQLILLLVLRLALGASLGIGSIAACVVAGLAVGVACAAWVHRRARRDLLDPIADFIERESRLLDSSQPASDAPGAGPGIKELAANLRHLADRTRLNMLNMGQVAEEREHLLTVLASISEGVLVTDEAGRTVSVNQAWRTLFDVTGEVQGRTALEVTRQTALDRMIAETLRSGEGEQIEIEVTRGRRLTIILTSSPLPDGAGVVVLARDLTPILRVAEIRRDFIANVSHELKTPLTAIRGFAETLSEGALEDPTAARRFTARILKQCQRLEVLLSDLLALSRLEHPTARSSWGEVDLTALIKESVDLAREAIAGHELQLSVDVEPVPNFPGDSEALVRLVSNLLENAIKYNRPGGRIEVRLKEGDGGLTLEVADTGIGIPETSVARIFERFYRVDKGRSRDQGGTGLGLAIVKHAAQLHGGSVEVESRLGEGSCFRVFIPLGPAQPDTAARRNRPIFSAVP